MKSAPKIIGDSSIKKLEYTKGDNFYYTVPFHQSLDELTLCVSTQIGCPMKCSFCATGDMPFVQNLQEGEIEEQILDGVDAMKEHIDRKGIKRTKVIAEGMGEASFNIENVVGGFQKARSVLFDEYDMERVDFGVSTVGNVSMIPEYRELALEDKEERTNYDFQLSLHSAIDDKRKVIIPNMPRLKGRELTPLEIVDQFSDLAKSLEQPMKFNYLLLNSGEGWNNYDSDGLKALVELGRHVKEKDLDVVVKLTRYSDTKKGFYSPDGSVYDQFIEDLAEEGISAYHLPLIGDDIKGACGQLHYE
tara:strand:- start:3139 stop:4050 length:912 start_codon:yes stop_codon:yes gene_type:complete